MPWSQPVGKCAMSSTKASSAPFVNWMYPLEGDFDSSDFTGVTAYLSNVPPFCRDVRVPCVTDEPNYPPLYYCIFTGATGENVTLGPLQLLNVDFPPELERVLDEKQNAQTDIGIAIVRPCNL